MLGYRGDNIRLLGSYKHVAGFLVLSTGIGDVFEDVAFVFYLVMDGVKSLGRKREYIETHTRSAEKYIS
jgi:hypothetical protein